MTADVMRGGAVCDITVDMAEDIDVACVEAVRPPDSSLPSVCSPSPFAAETALLILSAVSVGHTQVSCAGQQVVQRL